MINLIRNTLRNLKPGHIKVASNAFFILALRGAQRAVSLVTIYVLVRVLSQDQFGTYQFILSIVAFSTIFTIPGIQGAIMQSVSRGFAGTYRHGLKYSFLGSLMGMAVIAGVGTWYLLIENNPSLAIGIFTAAIFFPFAHGLGKWRGVVSGSENFSGLLKYDGGGAFLTAVAIICITPFFQGNYLIPLIIVLSGRALLNAFVTIRLFSRIDKNAPVEKGSVLYGAKLLFVNLAAKAAANIDKFMIFNFMSPAAVAIFYAAERIADLLKSLLTDLVGALAPRFARQKNYTKKIDAILKSLAFAGAIGAIVFAFTLMPWLLTFLFGDKYADAIPYAQSLICISIITYLPKMRSKFIKAKLDEPSIRFIVVSSSLARIIASVIFVPLFGIVGAVISAAFYSVAATVTNTIVMKRKYPAGEEDIGLFEDEIEKI